VTVGDDDDDDDDDDANAHNVSKPSEVNRQYRCI